jgi:tetratricopeptide (TPR) repeat protein
MKSQIRIVLFALIAPLAACSGDRPDETKGLWFSVPTLGAKAPVVEDKPAQLDAQVETPTVGEAPAVETPVPTTFKEAMELGKVLAVKGETSRAREVLEAAAKLDKKSAEPHIELARLFVSSGERGLAIKHATKAVKLAPESSQAYNTLGRAELARFNYDNAIIAFRQATELNPENVFAWNNLGYTYLQLEKYQDAADALVVAVEKKGATGYMFNNLGTAYEQLDQLDDARAAFDKGSELGSREAALSRKRLEGVDTIAIVKPAVPPKVESPKDETKTYDTAEPMPDPEDPIDESGAKVEEPPADAAAPI